MATEILQGNFTASGAAEIIELRGGVDWIEVLNQTTASAGAAIGTGYSFYWQKGMTQGRGFAYSNPDVPIYAQLAAGTGFYLLDTSVQTTTASNPSNPITNITSGSPGVPPRVTAASHGLVTGDIIRMAGITNLGIVGAQELGAIDFRVTSFDANNFDLSWMSPIVAAAAPAAKFYKISNELIYQPRQRVITSISQAAQAVVTFAAPHNFTVGQEFRFRIPEESGVSFGMTELNNIQATVVAISLTDNTVTVNVDTTGFNPFTFPVSADAPFTPAQGVPIGEDTAYANTVGADPLGDAVYNSAIIGMKLQPGVLSPAGVINDQIFWKAGVSFSVNNEF